MASDPTVLTLYTCYLHTDDDARMAIKSLQLLVLTATNGETIGWCQEHGLLNPVFVHDTHESMRVRLADHTEIEHPGYTTP